MCKVIFAGSRGKSALAGDLDWMLTEVECLYMYAPWYDERYLTSDELLFAENIAGCSDWAC